MRPFARIAAALVALLLGCWHELPAQVELGENLQRINLGRTINTEAVEILPIVSPDGSTLYFDRKYSASNVGGVEDQDDIYYARRQPDGSWSEARNIGAPLNTAGSDVLFWISPDGRTALVHHGARVRGKTMGMAIARRRGDNWSRPTPIHVEGLGPLGDSYYGFIAPDGRHLLLAYAPDSTRPGDLDIFVCRAASNDLTRWGRPRSLGPTINSPGFDGAPFLAADERSLYFASDGRGGMGSADLFVARRLDTSWTNWTAPVNLGPQVNTPRFDASLSIPADGRDLYLSGGGFMDERSFGRSDIYRAPLPAPLRPEPLAIIEGRLVAGRRGLRGLIRAERVADGAEMATTVSDASGNFRMSLRGGAEYRLTGGADGYVEGSVRLDIRDLTAPRRMQTTIDVARAGDEPRPEPAEREPGVYFESGSAELGARAVAGLERALATIRRDQQTGRVTRIVVIGHTDDIGSEESNLELSRRRAEAARAWLVARGIDESLFGIEARGETAPAAENSTARGRSLNRRVEVQYVIERTDP